MADTDGLLARVRTRLAMASAIEDLQRAGAAAAITVLVFVALRALGWWFPSTELIALSAAGILGAVPLIGLLARRYDRRALAARADAALGLSERVSTSVWAATAGTVAGPLGGLVQEDAAASASGVNAAALRQAFRPRVLRPQLAVCAGALLLAGGLYFVHPDVQAGESPAAKAARLADEDRIAEVARKMAEAAKRVKEAAKATRADELAKVASEIQRETERMARMPPRREDALRKLNELSDLARDAARRRAGLEKPVADPETAKASRALAELLKQMSEVGLDDLQRDLDELQKRLDEGAEGESPPSADELRDLASRVDALKRAMESADGMGADDLREKLRSIGNEDLLRKLAERLRELASKMEQSGYEGLQSESGGESMDLSELSREELQELLDALDEMAGMEDLAEMLRQGGGEMSGGRKLRLGGSGGT